VHVPPAELRTDRKDGERDFGEARLDKEVCDVRVVKALATRVPDVERGLHAREELDQVPEMGVAARVSAAADCDAAHLVGDVLEPCQHILPDLAKAPEPAVILADAPAAVIAPLPVRRAVPAAEGAVSLTCLK